eukprot:scaffold122216_cov35-Tisochrysis_lutea.AAC.1
MLIGGAVEAKKGGRAYKLREPRKRGGREKRPFKNLASLVTLDLKLVATPLLLPLPSQPVLRRLLPSCAI